MLSRFFSNSKPIVLISLLTLTSIWFWMYVVFNITSTKDQSSKSLLLNWLLLVTVLIIFDFINKRNKTNKQNSYAFATIVGLLLSTPEVLFNRNVLLSSLFLLLVIRRTINLQNPSKTKKKIFEASFWLTFVSIYEPFFALGFFVIYGAILFFVSQNYKNFFIPIFGILSSYTFIQLYNLLFFDNWLLVSEMFDYPNLKLNQWMSEKNLYFNLTYVLIIVWIGISGNKMFTKSKGNKRINLLILTGYIFLGILNIFNSTYQIEEKLIFIFIPLCFLLGSYILFIKRELIKESLLTIIFLLPIIKLIKLLFELKF